jgi:hypothetical protein
MDRTILHFENNEEHHLSCVLHRDGSLLAGEALIPRVL